MRSTGKYKKQSLLHIAAMTVALALSPTEDAFAAGKGKPDKDNKFENIVTAIVSPPVVSNGTIAGEPTEIIAVLNAPGVPDNQALDPVNFGHQIPAGGRMEVEIGGTFQRNGVDNDKEFVPINSNAFFVLVTGLPQMPITAPAGDGVQHGNYSIIDDGNRTITVIPNGGSGANGLEQARAREIGFKVVHIRPRPNTNAGPAPFTNGPEGTKGVLQIRIFDANGKLLEKGKGEIFFPAALGRVVGPTNAGLATPRQGSPLTVTAELIESVTYQRVAPDTELTNTVRSGSFSDGAPYAPRFLMFEELAGQPDSFIPFKGIAQVGYVIDARKPWKADLVVDSNGNGVADSGDEEIGEIEMHGPSRKSRGVLLENASLTTSGDGISGPNGSILNVPVTVGSETGVYTVTVTLDDGNRAVTTLIVE
jgi:hypothetical protein